MNPLTNVRKTAQMNELELKMGYAGNEKASWHSKYKNSAWIFFGGLPYDLTEGDVLAVFSQYGEIVNINLVRDRKTGDSKGFGFLCYEDQRSSVLSVDNLNGIKLLNRTIRVDHVEEYRLPEIKEGLDPEMQRLWEEGCAPQPLMTNIQQNEESSSDEDAAKRKERKRIKKEKKRKKRGSPSGDRRLKYPKREIKEEPRSERREASHFGGPQGSQKGEPSTSHESAEQRTTVHPPPVIAAPSPTVVVPAPPKPKTPAGPGSRLKMFKKKKRMAEEVDEQPQRKLFDTAHVPTRFNK